MATSRAGFTSEIEGSTEIKSIDRNAYTIPSLDGIRAISVLLVILSHVGYGHIIPGGLGVTVFFFLSGYLISTLLLNEFSHNGNINIPRFYIRRFFRLAPPLFLVLVIAYSLTLNGYLIGNATLVGFFAQLFYFANYYCLFFDGLQTIPKGSEVLWSLAVEEHFYIFYPVLIAAMLPRLRVRTIALTLFSICFLVLTWRYVLTSGPSISPDRTYYATDTRIDSILYGCIFAILANPMRGKIALEIGAIRGWALIIGGASLLIFTLLYRDAQFRESLRYTLQGIALMPIFYGVITLKNSVIYKLLNWSVLKKLGVYSYVIYLSHYIIIMAAKSQFNDNIHPLLLFTIGLSLSTILAASVDLTIDRYFRSLRKRYHS